MWLGARWFFWRLLQTTLALCQGLTARRPFLTSLKGSVSQHKLSIQFSLRDKDILMHVQLRDLDTVWKWKWTLGMWLPPSPVCVVYVCWDVYVCMIIYKDVCRGQRSTLNTLLNDFPSFFFDSVYDLMKLSDWLDLPASNPQGSFCFHLPSVGDNRCLLLCLFSCGCWRSELMLTSKYFTEWAIILINSC